MKKINIKSFATLALIPLFLGACVNDTPPIEPETNPITIDSTEGKTSRTGGQKMKPLSSEEAFLTLPTNLAGLNILDELSKKERKNLINNGKINGLTSSKVGNILSIQEAFQNTEDENEQISLLELATFIKNNGQTVLLVSAYKIKAKNRSRVLSDQQLFMEYNGTVWEDGSYQVPEVTIQDFYDKDFDVSALTETHIQWELDKNNPNQLNAIIQYDKYEGETISSDALITNESNQVSLIWEQNTFAKKITPLQ